MANELATVPERHGQDRLRGASLGRVQRRARGRPRRSPEGDAGRALAHRAAPHARRGDRSRLDLEGKTRADHRLPRPLHHRTQGAGRMAPTARSRGSRTRRQAPKASELRISDDDLRETIETNQLKKMKERGSDLTIFSPRASFMAHHIGDFATSSTWAAICNELCHRVAKLFPDNFIGAAMLPQSPGVPPRPAFRSWSAASRSTASSPSTSTPIRRAATGRSRRSRTGTGTRSTRRWSSTTFRP